MFCMNCGTKLADEAAFCFNCGTKVNRGEAPVAPVVETVAAPVEAPIEPVVETVAAPVEVTTEPVVETVEAPVETPVASPVYQQQPMQQPVYQQQPMQQPVYQQQPMQQPRTAKKGSKATVPAVLFAILGLFASVMISVSYFMDGEIGNGINNSVFALTSIIVIVYAVSKSNASSVLKGIMYLATAVVHIIFFGIAGFKTVFSNLSNAKNGTDYYYLIILLVSLICLYLYMLINIIRSFMCAKKASTFMLLFGYLAAILMVAMFVVNLASGYKEFFAFKFIPVDAGLVLLILADVFAVISRANKQAQ